MYVMILKGKLVLKWFEYSQEAKKSDLTASKNDLRGETFSF
jgi:hypothetical protein